MASKKPGPLFKKASMVHRAVPPPVTVPPTHILRVRHPANPAHSFWLDIAVSDDDQARARQRQLALWADFDARVFLYRAGEPGKPLCFVLGTR